MTKRARVSMKLLILSVLFAVLVACVPQSTPPVAAPTPTVPPGWERYVSQGQCSYVIDHPSTMDGTSQGTYSWSLSVSSTEPSEPVPNFVYISVIPDDLQAGEDGSIYNYNPTEAQTLLGMQVGESRSLRDFDPNLAPWFTYTRLRDRALDNQTVQTYENLQPWEFPLGTKEIRYYLKANGCTYLVGGYMATVGSGQPGAIDEALFDEIMATFRVAP